MKLNKIAAIIWVAGTLATGVLYGAVAETSAQFIPGCIDGFIVFGILMGVCWVIRGVWTMGDKQHG